MQNEKLMLEIENLNHKLMEDLQILNELEKNNNGHLNLLVNIMDELQNETNLLAKIRKNLLRLGINKE